MGIRINGSTSGYTELTGPAVGGNSTSGIILPSGTTAERPASGSAGQIRFNTDTGKMEYWSSTSDTPQWLSIQDNPINVISIEYYIVGGGGGGGGYNPYVSSPAYFQGTDGEDSRFDTAIAGGGGGGASHSIPQGRAGRAANGSGGGGGSNSGGAGGAGNGTGNVGGQDTGASTYLGGGGGGHGGAGGAANTSTGAGVGGVGSTTTFITTAQATANSVGQVDSGNVYFAGGGAGAPWTGYSTTAVAGGLGGGSAGVAVLNGEGVSNAGNGTANSGGGGAGYPNSSGGGGGGGAGGIVTGTVSKSTGVTIPVIVGAGGPPNNPTGTGSNGGNVSGGGSGVVILKYPATKTATFSNGITASTITDGSNKISFVTATTDSTQTVTFN